jgi:hypothetical protein
MPDRAANDIELFAGEKLHAIEAGAETFDVETLEHDPVVHPGANDDTIGAVNENVGFNVIGANGNRFGDGNRAETARIKNVDFSTWGGLGDRSGKGLTRSGPVAWIRIAPDTGNLRFGLPARMPL